MLYGITETFSKSYYMIASAMFISDENMLLRNFMCFWVSVDVLLSSSLASITGGCCTSSSYLFFELKKAPIFFSIVRLFS